MRWFVIIFAVLWASLQGIAAAHGLTHSDKYHGETGQTCLICAHADRDDDTSPPPLALGLAMPTPVALAYLIPRTDDELFLYHIKQTPPGRAPPTA